MDKFELKNKIYEIVNTLDKQVGEIMSTTCEDNETGELRSEVWTCLNNAQEKLRNIAYKIY